MKTYKVKVDTGMFFSIVKEVEAKNEVDAKFIAAKLFSFSGSHKYIFVEEVK